MINLRVISGLGPGDRLGCRRADSHFLAIDKCHYFSWLWRWMAADNRDITMTRLQEILNEAHDYLRQKPPQEDVLHMKDLLKQAITGMKHLRSTYETDPTTVARLAALIKHADDLTQFKSELVM